MRFHRAFALALGFLCAPHAFAQDNQCLRRTATLTILPESGSFVPDLAAADFRAEFRGKPVQILSVVQGDQPHRVLIVIDASGSMRGFLQSVWVAAIHIADQLVDKTHTKTSFALFVFGEKAGDRIEFAAGNHAVSDRLRQIGLGTNYMNAHVRGQTPLRDSILEGVKMFGIPQPGDAILVITDGGENASHSKSKLLRESLLANGIRLFSCVFFETLDGGYIPQVSEGNRLLIDVSRETGGLFVAPFLGFNRFEIVDFLEGEVPARASTALGDLFGQVRSFGSIEFLLPSPVTKSEDWKLTLTKEKSRELKDAQILYPHRLLPCSQLATLQQSSATPQ